MRGLAVLLGIWNPIKTLYLNPHSVSELLGQTHIFDGNRGSVRHKHTDSLLSEGVCVSVSECVCVCVSCLRVEHMLSPQTVHTHTHTLRHTHTPSDSSES